MANTGARPCARCGIELPQQQGSGRTRVYCSATCWSAARRLRADQTRKTSFPSAPPRRDAVSVNRRWVADAPAARVLAHPLRWQMLGLLRTEGPATAARLAALVGQSAANCSWHLRLLHRYGFVSRAQTSSNRDRPWQAEEVTLLLGDPAGRLPSDEREALLTVFHEYEIAQFRSWWRTSRQRQPRRWQEAAFSQLSLVWVTAEELEQLGTAIGDTVVRFTSDRSRPAARPRGARRVRVFAWSVPM